MKDGATRSYYHSDDGGVAGIEAPALLILTSVVCCHYHHSDSRKGSEICDAAQKSTSHRLAMRKRSNLHFDHVEETNGHLWIVYHQL